MDLSNDTPDKSREAIEASKLRIERLTLALPRLQERVNQIDHAAAVANWHGEYNKLIATANTLMDELDDTYVPLLQKLMDLRTRIVDTHWAFHNLGKRAPRGVDPSFPRIEPYSGFWDRMYLPDFSRPGVTHPPAASENIKNNWWRAGSAPPPTEAEIAAKDAEAEAERLAKQKESLHQFYKSQRDAEMRRIGLDPETGEPRSEVTQ